MTIGCEVCVIGGGVMGATLAASLCERNVETVLLEAGTVAGQGASAFSGGLVRCYDPDPTIMALSSHALAIQQKTHFAEVFSRAIRRTGMLYRAASAQADQIAHRLASYSSAEYPLRKLSAGDVDDMSLNVARRTDRVNLYEPNAGIGDVRLATRLMANLVMHQGLLLEQARVEEIDMDKRGECRVHTTNATLSCRVVVIAAGAWSHHWCPQQMVVRTIPLARLYGADLPRIPVIDAPATAYAIPSGRDIVQVGCQPRSQVPHVGALPTPDQEHKQDALRRLQDITGESGGTRVLDVLGGYDSYTRDGRPMLGFTSNSGACYLATGLNGIGFKLAPALADIASAEISRFLQRKRKIPRDRWPELFPEREGALPALSTLTLVNR
ncbi:hypothetical protein SR89_24940 [Klebsiella aerogenes]|uniref:NAD(P)/FAD-dependent oxidoreductase n=1 Tax=Klebsiella aerogenes TaxID=548 RepID=UPI0005EF0D8A|nr:FAD-binding oxidoreductase [Klebsiella aerogenes]KJO49757.1 hypothetical protein SR89_24940 [Klebsiella aerogenes]